MSSMTAQLHFRDPLGVCDVVVDLCQIFHIGGVDPLDPLTDRDTRLIVLEAVKAWVEEFDDEEGDDRG